MMDFGADILLRAAPSVGAARFGPQAVGLGRIPGWRMDSISHIANRNFALGPSGKQRLKNGSTDHSMKPAHSVDRTAAANSQIGHVEWLIGVVGVAASEREQIILTDPEA